MEDNKVVVLLNTPSSARWASSPSRGEVNNIRGFTLIELLVVVLIIGILVAVAVPQYQKAVLRSYYATLKDLTHSIAQAEETYFLANGQYTGNFAELDIDMPGGKNPEKSTDSTIYYDWGRCVLLTSSTAKPQLYCRRKYLGYMVRLARATSLPNVRFCIVFANSEDSDVRHRFCKQETGATKAASSDDSFVSYQYQD